MNTATARAPRDTPAEPGFAFTRHDFERVRELIHKQAGIALNPGKESMVYSRLVRRLRHTGANNFAAYLDWLERQPPESGEWQEFINALTTNLTSFWREAHHFPILAEHIKTRLNQQRSVSLWCCAASTGEEPYTMAITAMQATGSRKPPVSILATDIDTNVLAKGRTGVYDNERVETVAPDVLKNYFLRGRGRNQGLVRIQPDVQALVRFQALNLLHERWPINERFDAIFCRNVMIYFDKPTQLQVLRRLADRLLPHGLLFAGHSENFTHARDLFHLHGRTVYHLAPERAAAAAAAV